MRAYVILGKGGDQLSSLPLVYHYYATTGIKPVLMVSREYSSILGRIDYAIPYIYENGWDDLAGALKVAKQNFSEVISLQVFGSGFSIQKRTSSFQLDAWDRAGALKLWNTLPLKLNPDPKSVSVLGKIDVPFVLLADHSQSSPCEFKEELADCIKQYLLRHSKFHLLIRLSEIRLSNFVDFISIYNSATALVTIETAHLHLSKASMVPVFAWATDKPSLWHGSAWSSRFRFYARYSEFESRKSEMLYELGAVLDGKKQFQITVL